MSSVNAVAVLALVAVALLAGRVLSALLGGLLATVAVVAAAGSLGLLPVPPPAEWVELARGWFEALPANFASYQ